MVEVYGRRVSYEPALGTPIAITWDRSRDPDRYDMLEGIRGIPGRQLLYDNVWEVPINIEAAEFLDFWEFPVKGKLRTLLSATKKAPTRNRYSVIPGPEGLAEVIRGEDIRVYASKGDLEALGSILKYEDDSLMHLYVPLSPALLDWARTWALSVDPEVEEAVARLSAEAQAAALWAKSLNQASRASDPSDLPPAVLDKLKEMYG